MTDTPAETPRPSDRAAEIEAKLAALQRRRRLRRTIVGVSLLLAITGWVMFRSLVREAKAEQLLDLARASTDAGKYLIGERHLRRLLERHEGTRAARDGEALLAELQPEIGTQRLFVEAEQAETAADYAKAIQVYERVGEAYPATRLLGEARERLLDARRQQAAQESLEYAVSVERDCEFEEAAKAYEAVLDKYPGTAGAATAEERLAVCRQAGPIFADARASVEQGAYDAALAGLDQLLQAGLAYHGVYARAASVYERQYQWRRAAEMWELAQRVSPTEEGARRLRACLEKAGTPVAIVGVTSAQEVGSGTMVVSGRIVNNCAGPIRNVKVEINVFAESVPSPSAKPVLSRTATVAGPVAPGASHSFRAELAAPAEANTLEPRVVGYEEM